jgi:hypothetical protein
MTNEPDLTALPTNTFLDWIVSDISHIFVSFCQEENIDYNDLEFRTFKAEILPQSPELEPEIQFSVEARTPDGKGAEGIHGGTSMTESWMLVIQKQKNPIYAVLVRWLVRLIANTKLEDGDAESEPKPTTKEELLKDLQKKVIVGELAKKTIEGLGGDQDG